MRDKLRWVKDISMERLECTEVTNSRLATQWKANFALSMIA